MVKSSYTLSLLSYFIFLSKIAFHQRIDSFGRPHFTSSLSLFTLTHRETQTNIVFRNNVWPKLCKKIGWSARQVWTEKPKAAHSDLSGRSLILGQNMTCHWFIACYRQINWIIKYICLEPHVCCSKPFVLPLKVEVCRSQSIFLFSYLCKTCNTTRLKILLIPH